MTRLAPSDSTQAMAILVSAYDDDEGDEDTVHNTSGVSAQPDDEASFSPDARTQHAAANFISDDDDPHHSPHDKHEDDKHEEQTTRSPAAEPRPPERKTTRLVSYGPDEVDEADDDEDSGESLPSIFNIKNFQSISRVASTASVVRGDADVVRTSSQSPASINEGDIQLPPEPAGNCSKRLQEKIADKSMMLREGKDLNAEIQRLKEFRNPSIYEKLIKMCGIDEQGTNYPPELYNPLIWGPQSSYDELARIQTEMLHEKEKEAKKSKVEFQKGVKKSAPSADTSAPEVKRKISKWDERGSAATSNITTAAAHGSSKPK